MLFDPLTDPTDAVMVAVPSARVELTLQVTRPVDTVATFSELELQFAVVVRSFVAPPTKVPVAFSCCVPPFAIS